MKAWKKYLITLLVGFAAAGLIIWSKDIFAQTTLTGVFHILCDAFFVVAVVTLSSGLLIFSSNEGTFDMVMFGLKTFWGMFRKNDVRTNETFYDYRASREEKKTPFGFLLICGLIFLAISMVMYYLYYRFS